MRNSPEVGTYKYINQNFSHFLRNKRANMTFFFGGRVQISVLGNIATLLRPKVCLYLISVSH